MYKVMAVIATVLGLALLAPAAAVADTPLSCAAPEDHPCVGYRYKVIYDLTDGRIRAVESYQTGPGYVGSGVRPGVTQGEIEVSSLRATDLRAFRANPEAYYVDTITRQLKMKESGQPVAAIGVTGGAGPIQLFVGVPLSVVVGLVILLAKRRLRRVHLHAA